MSSVARRAATAEPKSHLFAGTFTLLAPHLAELDRFLRGQLAAFEPEIRAMAEACLDPSGKRIRPALVFLSGWRGADGIAPELVRVAAVVEFIHLATFVHHQVVDDESGATPAVLLGDALFAHGLHLATQFPTPEICAAITASARRVCTGEVVQALRRRSTHLTRAEYLRIVDLKTAELFRVSCFFGAQLAGAEPGYVEAASRFGRHLGIACQIYEDLVNCFGEEARGGATPGTDLARGTLTLPLLALLARLPAVEADALRAEIAGERPPQRALRLRQMRELAIFPHVAEAVQAEIDSATAALHAWSGHPATPLLLGLCDALQVQLAKLRPAGAA